MKADLVGFHTFTYARHFLQACHRTLGVPFQSRRWGTMGLNVSGRNVTVTVNHIGIEPVMLRRCVSSCPSPTPNASSMIYFITLMQSFASMLSVGAVNSCCVCMCARRAFACVRACVHR